MLELIDQALAEDIGAGDVTTQLLVPPDAAGRAIPLEGLAGEEGVDLRGRRHPA